ncbi:IclR family transcriptional regulator [Achromobacter aloeverae]|uniref:IclR family transcriptional regulator n=1 Tax=Achromobacter aloeverae TaxID=1750518 RepID=A0A4Q1HG78_9BURK|nr:IclR family transcriptional regulator [Achromobacter aloeverae]RXN86109.1 IclR family transcriptional regulator [Achromobacter aloeverae]
MPTHADPAFATTLAHGLAVLQTFRHGEPALSNRELSERTGLSKATISRLTTTLMQRGLLRFDLSLRRYLLGPALLSLSYPLLTSIKLRQLARPAMYRLAQAAGGSASLGMHHGMHMVYLETCRGHDAIAFRPDIGALLPLMPSAMGRAWLAQAVARDDRQGIAILDALRGADPAGWRRHQAAWEQARRDYADFGYCVSEGDWHADVHAVAVPLRRQVDGETLVFNCGVPRRRIRGKELRSRIAPRLLTLVARMEKAIATETSDG